MPTSREEADKIYSIINEYLGPKISTELTKRLDEEVGQQSDNESLRISLNMLRNLYKV